MTDLVVAKFGGTSVADFDAMNRSIDVALLDANTRIVVLSASAGVTNILVALAGGLEPTERFSQLDALRQIQFNILERLRYPNVIREEIERLLENITTLAEAAALASSTALTDELVSHGELMSTLLFVEILRERGIQAPSSPSINVILDSQEAVDVKPGSKVNTPFEPRLRISITS